MIPDPDKVRIRESYQTKGECLRIWILEFLNPDSGLFFPDFGPDPRLIPQTRYSIFFKAKI